jgi:uncharacterized protein YybS (DUF2232 family)
MKKIKGYINYTIKFTISKVMGVVIIIGGFALSFYLKESGPAVTLATVGGGMIAVKTVTQDIFNKRK